MKKKVILIIDDDILTVKTIMEYLQDTKFSFEVIHATSLTTAIEISHSVRPDLIMVNCELPEMSGFDIIKKLKTLPVTMDIPVIVTASQLAFVNDLYSTLSEWPVHYLSKPISGTDLKVQVSTVLALSDPLKEIEKQKSIITYMRQFTFSLMDIIPIPLFYQNNDETFLGCNKAFEILFKKNREDFVGKNIQDILPKPVNVLLEKGLNDLLHSSGDIHFTAEVREEIENMYLMVGCTVFRNGENEYSGYIGAVTDITPIVRRERALNIKLERIHSKNAEIYAGNIKKLKDELVLKQKELSIYLELLKNTEKEMDKMFEDVKNLSPFLNDEGKVKVSPILRNYKHKLLDDSWLSLQSKFQETNFSFFELLEKKYPSISKNEKTLCAYIKMNLAPSEISKMTRKSLNSINVALTRLRAKLNVNNNKELKKCLMEMKIDSSITIN